MAAGKAIGPLANSGEPKGKRALGYRTTPVPRVQRSLAEPQVPSKAGELSSWRRARSTAARLSSTCSSPVRYPLAPGETACTCSQINGCICADDTPKLSACEQSERKSTKNQIHLAKDPHRPQFSPRPTTTPNDTIERRFYCHEPDCSVSCSREHDLGRHQKSQHSATTFECSYPSCHFQHSRRDKVLKHTREVHASRPIACPAILYSFPSTAEGANTIQDASRDKVNASKRPGRGVPQANLRAPGHPKNGETAPATTRFALLDAETAAPDQRKPSKPSEKAEARPDAVTRARTPKTSASHPSDIKSRRSTVQRSRSLPRNSILGLNLPVSKQASFRTTVGHLEAIAKRRYGGPSGRPVSTPPELSTFAPGYLDSAINIPPIASPHQHTAPQHAPTPDPSLVHRLGSSPHDVGGSGRSPAPPQQPGNSWADVVRNTPNATSSSATVLPNNTENKDDVSGERSKGKRRKLNEEGDEELFVCIGHHRGHPELDWTSECATTLKEFFSQLERHHERHKWFYCARCLETFRNAEARKAHRNGQRCHLKCVTEDCPRYGTFPPFRCAHSGKDSDSGEAVWMELFRVYRRGEDVPYPKVRRIPGPRQPTRSVASSHRDTLSSPTTPSRRGAVSPTPTVDQPSSRPANNTRMIAPFSPTGTRSRTLLTLADLLWLHIHTPGRQLSLRIRRLYEQAMGSALRDAEIHEADYAAPVLEPFVNDLWLLAQGQIDWTEAYGELVAIAGNWLSPASFVNGVEASNIGANSAQMFTAQAPLNGVGQQFQGDSQQQDTASMPTAQTLPPHLTASRQMNAIEGQEDSPPWSHVFAGSHQNTTQTQYRGPHMQGPSLNLPNQAVTGLPESQQSYGTRSSPSVTNFDPPSMSGTIPRNLSYSTDPTSIDAADLPRQDHWAGPRPGTSDSMHKDHSDLDAID